MQSLSSIRISHPPGGEDHLWPWSIDKPCKRKGKGSRGLSQFLSSVQRESKNKDYSGTIIDGITLKSIKRNEIINMMNEELNSYYLMYKKDF